MTEHELKTWPSPYEAIVSGAKRFEVRNDDRGFEVGHVLHLREWDPGSKEYSGRSSRWRVTYILRNVDHGKPDRVTMSIVPADGCKLEDMSHFCTLHGHDMARQSDATECENCGMIGLRRQISELDRENAELRARRDDAFFELAQIKASNEDHARQIGSVITTAIENATFPLDERLRAADVQLVELADLRARLARYEAPGPALLTAEHDRACGTPLPDDACTCGAEGRAEGYREQHARCVAVVEQMLLRRSLLSSHDALVGCDVLREAIAALTK